MTKRRPRNRHYNVRPRYTPGSPSGVPEETAMKVAADEKKAYERTLTGVYGEEERAKAEKEGLLGIAEEVVERRKHWDVRDLITGETYTRPFPDSLREGQLRRRR